MNFKLVLKDLYNFCQNPKRNDYSKLSILEEIGNNIILHNLEIFNWDGKIIFNEKTKVFTNLEKAEIIYHNSFKYLQKAKNFLKEKNFEEGKKYLNLIKLIDEKSSEAKDAVKIIVKVELEEIINKAEAEEKEKNLKIL